MNLIKKIGSWFDVTEGSGSRRPTLPGVVDARRKGIEELIRNGDFKDMVAISRKLYSNYGPIKGAIDGMAIYSVGDAFLPLSLCPDMEWAKKATKLLVDLFYPICDVRGMLDFQGAMYLASVSVDRDADMGIVLTESESGFPMLQFISSYQITSENFNPEILKDGPYKGLTIYKGVITNSIDRPVAYRIVKKDGKFQDVSARDMVFLRDLQYFDQTRGICAIAHGINQARTLMATQEFEEFATMLASTIAIIEHNETGMPDPTDPRNLVRKPIAGVPSEPVTEQSFFGGMIKYFKAGTGSKMETLKSERPGDAWDKFNDRLVRVILAGYGLPYEVVWKSAESGPNVRLAIGRAARSIKDRQSLLKPIAKRLVIYALAKFIKRGDLEAVPGWMDWDFTIPQDITIDSGRESQSDRLDVLAGIASTSQIIRKQGGSEEQVYRDILRLKKLKKQLEEEEGETFDEPVKNNKTGNATSTPSNST